MAPKCRVTSPIRRELASCRFLVRGELLPESGALYPFRRLNSEVQHY